MKLIFTVITIFGCVLFARAQQVPDRNYFRGMSFIWNPAMTGDGQYWETFANYRRQWLGFEGAPRTSSIGIHYPFVDFNMGLGGFFIHDYTAPIRNTTVGGTYSYQFELGLFKNDRLALGIMGFASQFLIDAVEIDVVDPDDVLIPVGESAQFTFNAGGGFYYVSHSNNNSRYDRSYFFFGAAANQALPSDLIFSDSDEPTNYKRSIHANATLGGRIINDEFFIEPYIWVNYAAPNIFNTNVGFNAEVYSTLWGGLNYSTNETFSIQAGYIIADGLLTDESTLRIGTIATLSLGTLGKPRGISYEFILAYRFDL